MNENREKQPRNPLRTIGAALGIVAIATACNPEKENSAPNTENPICSHDYAAFENAEKMWSELMQTEDVETTLRQMKEECEPADFEHVIQMKWPYKDRFIPVEEKRFEMIMDAAREKGVHVDAIIKQFQQYGI